MDESGRKRGGKRSIESSVSSDEHARLQKARDELYARIAREENSPLLEAVRDDILSRSVAALKDSQPDKKLTSEDIATLRAEISPGQIQAATMRLLMQVFEREQHNAQLNGRTREEKTYRPDLSTLTDAIRDLAPQAAKKFVKVKSATFLLEHHQQMIQQRIREMAGKESLLKPVEFIAETSDPAYYVGKLFYKGSFSKVSIIEENCVGTEGSYFEDSKVNPETGRPATEIFVVMKRWEHATHSERVRAVRRLLDEQTTVDAIDHELWQMFEAEGIDYSTGRGGKNTLADLFDKVGEKNDTFVAGDKHKKILSANDFLYRAVAKVLNGEKKQEDFPEQLPYVTGLLADKLARLPKFTDIPEMTIEYNVAQNSIRQFKTRAHGKADQPPAKDDPRKNVILSTLWGIARSERFNEKSGKMERRMILSVYDLDNIFLTADEYGLMLIKEGTEVRSAMETPRELVKDAYWSTDALQNVLVSKSDFKDFELLGGWVRVNESTPNEILDALKDLAVGVEVRASATRGQLDRITHVNGRLHVLETNVPNSVNLRNLTYAGQIDVRDVRRFRADKLEEVEIRITSMAEENSFKNLHSVPEIELEPGGVYENRGLVFVAPKLAKSVITLRNNRRFSRYDCPVPCATKLGP